ncbi:thiamine pyrophosphate-binding protein (plasmid) [Cupriavidus basilensis]
MSGRAAFLKLLQDEGVTHVFGNPGTTELALMEAMPEATGIEYVLGLQESVVLAMADGFARATGKLAACNLHCTPGLGHAMGALYNAKFSGSPLIVTAGQYELGYGLLEPMLYEPLVPIAQPLVKWAYEIQRVEDLPRVVRRAAKIALTPPFGPVFLSLPGSILDDEAELDLGASTRVYANGLPPIAAQQQLVDAMLASEAPLIIAGRELAEQDAMAEAQQLAELIGAPVYHEPVPYNTRYPTGHIAFMGDLTRNQAKVRKLLSQHDLLVVLGGDLLRMSAYSETEPMPSQLKVIHISEREWELGKNYATQIAVKAGVGETLRCLLPKLASARSADQSKAALARLDGMQARNWGAQRARFAQEIHQLPSDGILDPRTMAYAIAEAVPPEAIVVEEAPTTAPLLSSLLETTGPRNYFGLASGGLGFAMGGAVGAALGRPGTPVVAVVGDGSAMYAIQALWTAAHLNLPITYVIVNNRSYRIIKERMVAMRQSDRFLGMDLVNPALDFVDIAKGMGVPAERIETAEQLTAALRVAIQSGRPSLLEVLVNGGEQRLNEQ